MALSGGLEDNVLTMLCWDEKHAAEVLLQVPPALFSTKTYRKIAEVAAAHITQYSRPPRAHLRDLLEDDMRRGDEGIVLRRIVDSIDRLVPELQPQYVLDQLHEFVALRKISAAIENASDAVVAGDLEKAKEALYSTTFEHKGSPGIWLHEPDQVLAFLQEREEDFFSSGVEVLDRRGVRPRRKTLFLILAPKKSGKSWWLAEMGKRNILARKRVLHITLEMSEEDCAQRYVQALYAMTANQEASVRYPIFKRDQLGRCTGIDFDTRVPQQINNDSRAEVAAKLERLRNRPPLLIKEFPTGSLTVAQLRAFLDTLEKRDDFKPDLVLIDYPKLMKHDLNNMRLSLGRGLEELRGLAMERDFALVCPAQGNRQSEGAKVVSSTMLGEDWSMSQTCDILCSLSRTKSERNVGLARIFVDAARKVEDKYLVMVSQSYPTGQFCLDSVYMSKYIEEEVARVVGETGGDADDDE